MTAGESISDEEKRIVLSMLVVNIQVCCVFLSHLHSGVIWPPCIASDLFLGHQPYTTRKEGVWLLPESAQEQLTVRYASSFPLSSVSALGCLPLLLGLCTATVAALMTLLLWYNFSLMPQQNRAELRASLAAALFFFQGMWRMLRSV